jgi:hypothetical protein
MRMYEIVYPHGILSNGVTVDWHLFDFNVITAGWKGGLPGFTIQNIDETFCTLDCDRAWYLFAYPILPSACVNLVGNLDEVYILHVVTIWDFSHELLTRPWRMCTYCRYCQSELRSNLYEGSEQVFSHRMNGYTYRHIRFWRPTEWEVKERKIS